MDEDKQFHPTFSWECSYLSMLVLQKIQMSKKLKFANTTDDEFQTCVEWEYLHLTDIMAILSMESYIKSVL